jgi:hypothetical protein
MLAMIAGTIFFLSDAPRRAFCDDSKTTVGKISSTEAIVLLYDTDLEGAISGYFVDR